MAKEGEIDKEMEFTEADQPASAIRKLHIDHRESATSTQQIVGFLTTRIGRPAFAVILAAAIVAWIGLNLLLGRGAAIDPPPFQWLQGAMALMSLFLAVFILSAQTHQDALYQRRDSLSLELAILVERKTSKIIRMLDELRKDHPQMEDRWDDEAQAMGRPTDTSDMLEAVKQAESADLSSTSRSSNSR